MNASSANQNIELNNMNYSLNKFQEWGLLAKGEHKVLNGPVTWVVSTQKEAWVI